MNKAPTLDRIRIVLSRTSHPGNIGAAARAMKTMGLGQLVLVDPRHFPDPVADARASGAGDVLERAVVVGSLREALSGTIFAAALTARRRELALPMATARDAADVVASYAQHGDVALVFGNETSGLSNDDVALCQMPVMIPTNPEYSSLNLAAAVQILCYELRMRCESGQRIDAPEALPASFEEVERFHEHLETVMASTGFFDPQNPKRLLQRVRRLFGRIRLEKEEVGILRGFLSAVEQKPD
ncbi:RNA methyltransferase [Cognatazoarcus halotolerans]|uniref:RNA methyltransferase n=1 Tax=Cognatazoarcus halotolerans TaxID=2686016 RepID=UPI00135B69FB|nr:RNA methyltransferase [Cognatazoarcus halotolerans]MCB1900202.1 RNA methyltransferase [Rhodocyclaceae bacterium]MCP5309031.1 RNA methyltransferase [Zoogloeaceae bacterium]